MLYVWLMCVAALIYIFSAKASQQIKMTIFLLSSGLICLAAIPFMILRPRNYKNALVPAWALRLLCKAIGINMEVRGLENVNPNNGGVVLMNHQSNLDLLVLAYLWPIIGRATVVAKKELLYLPFFGIGAYLWGTLFINRSKSNDSIKSINQESKAIKEQNAKLLFFPEGTRNQGNKLLPFKKGSFHIAVESKCPIQPVVISQYNFLKAKHLDKGFAFIHILPEIPTIKYNKDNLNELIDRCHNIMQEECDKINEEVQLFENRNKISSNKI